MGVMLITSLTLVTPTSAQQNTAQITIETVSNSAATRGKNYLVSYYADEACSKRGKSSKVFEKKYANNLHTFNALSVEVDQAFIFQVAYLEKRRGEVRRCSAMANVDLQVGHDYKAVFNVIGEVVGCKIEIFDLTTSEATTPTLIEHKKPVETCAKVGKKGYGNGTPVYTYKDRLG